MTASSAPTPPQADHEETADSLIRQLVVERPVADDGARPSLAVGQIETTGTGEIVVAVGGDTHICRRAAGCLVKPVVGDTVLVALAPSRDHADDGRFDGFVIQILARSDAASSLVVDAGEAETLRLAADTVEIAARRKAALTAPALSVATDRIAMIARTSMSLIGGLMTQAFRTVRVSARDAETVAGTVSTVAETRLSRVKGTDTEQLGSLVQTVEGVASKQARTQLISAEDDLRIDGERIGMG